MDKKKEASLSQEFVAKRQETLVVLRKHMEARGLREKDGWRVSESMRQRDGKTELVMRPIHLQLTAPDDLECVVAIDEPGNAITTECDA